MALKETVDNKPTFPVATEEMYIDALKITTESVVTDIVEGSIDELHRFAQYWKRLVHNNVVVNQDLIPADLLIERTIPITDMIISSLDHHTNVRITIKIPDDEINNGIIGVLTFVETGLAFPLAIDTKK